MRNFSKFNLFLTIIAIILSTVPASGQTSNGTILGTITDSSHAVIPNVQVSLTDTGTNTRRSDSTNSQGYFVFPNLAPGTYRVDVEQPGFQKTVRSDIGLDANTTVRVDLQLTPGAVTETVDVTGEAPVLKTDRADTGGQIGSQTLDTMPMLHNRNYQSLLEIVPGVQKSYRDHSAFYNSQEHLQSVVNGLDHRNSYMLEGLDNNVEDLTGIIPPADAIANVDVSTTNYDPELGRAGGAVTNVVLKSGTNSYHGSAFEYNRVNALQARDPFSTTPAAHSVYNQFGGAFGGRIKRDKLFFFGDYQGSRDIAGQSNVVTIPTMAFRRGDLSASPAGTVIYNPATGTPDGKNRVPFANNQVGPISPIAAKLLSFLPPPTNSALSNNFQEDTVQSKPMDQFDTKIDYVVGPNDRLFVRYSFQRATVNDPGLFGPNGGIYGGPHNGGFQGSGPSRNQSPGLNYTHILSPTLVTEFRFGIVRNHNQAINVDSGLTTSKDIGIPGVNLDKWSSGLTEVRFDSQYNNPMLGFSNSLPWIRSVTNFNIVNNWTKTMGTHIFKFGADIRRERQDLLQTQVFNPRGRFVFTAGTTSLNGGNAKTSYGNSFASFLLDQPGTGSGRDLAVIFPARRNTVYNLYFQDKWQVSQKLTVDLGLRWEYWPSSTPHHPGGFSNYNPFNNTLELAGIGSVPNDQGINSHLTSFGPRIGTAYRMNDKTVFRAGYGISYIPRNTNVYNFPVSQATQLPAINSFVAVGSMATGFPPPSPAVLPSTGIIVNPPAQAYTYIPKDLPQGYVESWNVTLQRALPANFSAEVAFVGNHGVNVPTSNSLNINASRVPGSGAAGEPLNILFGRTLQTLEPWNAPSYYEGLQVRLNRRFTNGFTLFNSYAYGKAIDFNPSTPGANNFNVINFAANKGLSDWDRRNIYTMSAVYELPFGQGKHFLTSGPGKWVLGGWQLNGLWSWESGLPLDISTSPASLNAPGNINRPDVTGPVQIFGGIGPGTLYFDTSKFKAPANGKFGNLGRNVLHAPHLFDIDASIFRRFPVRERMNLEFRAEAFNLTNTPQYDRPDTTFTNGTFGQVISANGKQSVLVNNSRQLQFSMRLQF
ncbi:MAG TPA: TonB-dependent receptor [Bryobacteraceae bacterium]|nr:TonB-dependent receptor [Bryobacteraceae bacterium]